MTPEHRPPAIPDSAILTLDTIRALNDDEFHALFPNFRQVLTDIHRDLLETRAQHTESEAS